MLRVRHLAWRRLGLALAAATFAAGIWLPIMQIDRLYFFSQTPSILNLVGGLWERGDEALAALIALFSILFPLLKLLALAMREMGVAAKGAGVLQHLSKWSMIDVMLVAIAIFAAKSSGLASVVVLPGLWCYAASAILMGLLLPKAE